MLSVILFAFVGIATLIALSAVACLSKQFWIRIACTTTLLAAAIAGAFNAGNSLGRSSVRMEFGMVQRMYGEVFSGIEDDLKNGYTETAKARLRLLNEKWYDVRIGRPDANDPGASAAMLATEILNIKRAGKPATKDAVTPETLSPETGRDGI